MRACRRTERLVNPRVWRRRYTLNIWDVGGQKTLRAYWRNYYEATDGLVWVVDAADVGRIADCAAELRALLAEEKARNQPSCRRNFPAPDTRHHRHRSWRAQACWCWPTNKT